ncbi:thioredoxin family protein [Maribacter halichondriae]|uniref:thioredoxin family protein n=1 Tax=Maribacter halichondriae TaxID=2980554 RepID=UPI0023581277|nr:thioredoxin family protein [Maribacter sp. Hal144]
MQTVNPETTERMTQELIKESLPNAISYNEYRELVAQLAQEGKSTGPEHTEALTNYTQLNDKRMKRWDKTLKFTPEALDKIAQFDQKTTWLVLTESWCGDASPSLPVMHKIAELNPNITLKILLRDDNGALMNRFLTKGAMSIPKLIAIDDSSEEVVGDWGPRSKNATKLVEDFKAEHGTLTAEFKQDLQVWYNKDKGQSVLDDLTRLLLK